MWWIGILIGISIVVTIVAWITHSIKIVGPEEMAVKVIYGKPVAFCDSGWIFDLRFPLPGCFLKKYLKKRYNLDYPSIEVISKEGWYPPSPEKIRPKGRRRWYEAQKITVHATAYIRFPRKDEMRKGEPALFEIYRSGVPTEEKALLNWTREAVMNAVRLAFGKITWKEATEEIEKITKETKKIFTKSDGLLMKAGFTKKGVDLAIPEIKRPAGLEKAYQDVERERLEAETAPFESEQRAEETMGYLIQIFCKLTGYARSTIERELRKDPSAFVKKYKPMWEKAWDLAHRRMAIDGRSYVDIRVKGARGIERMLLNLATAWQRMPMGRGRRERTEKKESKKVIGRFPTKKEAERALERAIEETLKK